MSSSPKLSAPERQARLRVCQSCGQFARCPSARVLALVATTCPQTLWPEVMRGAGDLVAAVVQPIAGAIDAVFGTDLKICGGCRNRRKWLNTHLRF